jgi:protease-4
VGEGRIYSGVDGRSLGLVDEVGGLQDGIDMARRAAGLQGREVEIVEVNPESGFWNLGRLLPFPLSRLLAPDAAIDEDLDPAIAFIRTALQHQPAPFVMLPPGFVPSPVVWVD